MNFLKIGFVMERTPCGQFAANAQLFRIGVLAYNLFIRFKHSARALPSGAAIRSRPCGGDSIRWSAGSCADADRGFWVLCGILSSETEI